MWMDFVHTIDADGWTMLTKQDVVDWCLFRLDDLRKDKLFKYTHMLDFYNFFNECKDIIRRDEWHYNEASITRRGKDEYEYGICTPRLYLQFT